MMKRILINAAVVAGICLWGSPAAATTLTILHTNDTHAHLLPWGPRDADGNSTWGGMSRLATVIGMNRLSGGDILLLDAGDFSVGDFMFQKYLSIPELSLMKALTYDAVALGNHEFDLYPSTLAYELGTAGFPDPNLQVLCANLDLSGYPDLGYFVRPYTVKQYGDLKVGLLALLTESANQISNPAPVVVLPALAQAQAWVDSLTAQGCHLVVLMSHLGFEYDQLLASSVTGIDVIIGGHSHTDVEDPLVVGQTLVVQAGAFGRYLGKLTLSLTDHAITGWDYERQFIDASVPAEPNVEALLSSLQAGVEADPRFGPVYTADIATAGVDLTKDMGRGLFKDTPLGNMIADAFRERTGTDIALQPQGFCAQTVYQGVVRGADVFQAVPYGFDETSGLGLKLVTFETDGLSLLTGLEFTVYNLPFTEDFVLQSSNMTYAYNSSAPAGNRVDYASVRVDGVPLDPFGTYSVTTSDAVVGFVSQIPGFVLENLQMTDDFVYTIARDFMTAHSPVVYYIEGRVMDLAGMDDPLAAAGMMIQVIDEMLANGSIDNAGIAHALQSKLEAVMRGSAADHDQAASGALGALLHQISAQSGKHITEESADLLAYLALQLQAALESEEAAGPWAAESASQPLTLHLKGNHPNPFNPTTRIEFSLGTSATTRVEVFNIMGQRVRVLFDGTLAAGPQAITWDGTDQRGQRSGSGMYFYRITALGRTAMGKMLMLK